MNHCTIAELADQLLGEASNEVSRRVSDHLGSGCQHCNSLNSALARICRVGRFDTEHQPPAGVVRTVKALDGSARSSRRPRRVRMHLSFDSMSSTAPVGARTMHSSNRHLVFYSQNFALDLRMDYERSLNGVVVVGQLLNRDWGPLSDVPAYLVSGDREISRSTTGRLGEFHMEGRPRGPMHLRLAVNDEELIDVELDRRRSGDLRPVLVDSVEAGDAPSLVDPGSPKRIREQKGHDDEEGTPHSGQRGGDETFEADQLGTEPSQDRPGSTQSETGAPGADDLRPPDSTKRPTGEDWS